MMTRIGLSVLRAVVMVALCLGGMKATGISLFVIPLAPGFIVAVSCVGYYSNPTPSQDWTAGVVMVGTNVALYAPVIDFWLHVWSVLERRTK